MKKTILLFVIFTVALISGCCHKKKIAKQSVNDQSLITKDSNVIDDYLKFEAYYFHTTESTYEEVKIKSNKIYFTYFKDEKGDCSQWIQQKPCWSEDKLKRKEANLSNAEIDSLLLKITTYEFWKLDTVIGNPKGEERYYSFVLSFKNYEHEKSVLFKSVPGGIVMPASFRKSRDELMKLVRTKIGLY